MRSKRRRRKQRQTIEQIEQLNQPLADAHLASTLEENIALFKSLFAGDEMIRYRIIPDQNDKPVYCLIFCDGLVDAAIISEYVIAPLMQRALASPSAMHADSLTQSCETTQTTDLKAMVQGITYGDTLLLSMQTAETLLLCTKGFMIRATQEPENEKILSGPREGFTENLMTNLAMVHKRVRTNELKVQFRTMGKRTQTSIAIAYMGAIVLPDVLARLNKRLARLEALELDGILDANYITENIRDNRLSPFRNIGYTERPDTVVGKLLEGRIAIFVDGSPVALTLPYLFIENFQSSEDYYLNSYYTSVSRFLRMLGFVLTITVPAFFIAIVAFHVEMLPTPLMISISTNLASVPLPAALEAFLMLLVFDLLRETGVRMPSHVGQALSIVGALVIGQAAVEAKLVSAPMIIVVALTGITGLLVPKMSAPIIIIRSIFLLLASLLGLYGLVIGLVGMLVHMLRLKTLAIPQLLPENELKLEHAKDTLIRASWTSMLTRPSLLTNNAVRMYGDEDALQEDD